MSALPEIRPGYRRMSVHDLDAVMAIEREIYAYPWSRGNFSDSLEAGYQCWIVECAGMIVGYSVSMIAAGEAHLLNLSIAAQWQRRGLGRAVLEFVTGLARDCAADRIYLEVRASNSAALALYAGSGFTELAVRRGYYPADGGREDAVVMELTLGASRQAAGGGA
jgi:[ribosomal protein S18]-alanine N-acetyltransferase